MKRLLFSIAMLFSTATILTQDINETDFMKQTREAFKFEGADVAADFYMRSSIILANIDRLDIEPNG